MLVLVPSCNSLCLSSRLICVYASDRTNRMARCQLMAGSSKKDRQLTCEEVGFSTAISTDDDIMARPACQIRSFAD